MSLIDYERARPNFMTTAAALRAILRELAPAETVDTFVETGTADAMTTCVMLNVFKTVHSIELSGKMYRNAVKNFGGTRIQFHHGNSALVLPRLIREELPPDKPVVFYLDAHTCGGYGGPTVTDVPCPLWAELEAIRTLRKPRDIIVVDDIHAWGKARDDWRDITLVSLAAAIFGDGQDGNFKQAFDAGAFRRVA